MCARVVDIPQIVVDTPLADAPFPGFSSQRRAPRRRVGGLRRRFPK